MVNEGPSRSSSRASRRKEGSPAKAASRGVRRFSGRDGKMRVCGGRFWRVGRRCDPGRGVRGVGGEEEVAEVDGVEAAFKKADVLVFHFDFGWIVCPLSRLCQPTIRVNSCSWACPARASHHEKAGA
jgi:hypothetical protein